MDFLPCKNSKISHFKPDFSPIIPIQFEYCEYIRNKLNFLRFLILIKLQLSGKFGDFEGAKKLLPRFLLVPRQYPAVIINSVFY